jgi:hypothetical protein
MVSEELVVARVGLAAGRDRLDSEDDSSGVTGVISIGVCCLELPGGVGGVGGVGDGDLLMGQ